MTQSTLEAVSREDLVSYHDTYFRPNAAYLIVVGDITPDDAYAKPTPILASGSVPTFRSHALLCQIPHGQSSSLCKL